MIMGITGICAVILSLIGVILIYKTFEETRRAAEIAKATVSGFKENERGKLHFTYAEASGRKEDDALIIIAKLRNVGRAKVCVTKAIATISPTANAAVLTHEQNLEEWVDTENPTSIVFSFSRQDIETNKDFFCQGQLLYSDQFSEAHSLEFKIRLFDRQLADHMWDGTDQYFRVEKLISEE